MPELTKDQQLMKSLIGKLYQVLTGGNDIATPDSENFIAWCTPGIPFDPEDLMFAQKGLAGKDGDETRKLLAQAADFSRLVNFVPDPSGVYSKEQQDTTFEQQGTLLWNVYSNVLQFSEVASGDLTEKQKEKMDRFQNHFSTTVIEEKEDVLTGEKKKEEKQVVGPVLKAYNQKMADYLSAATKYNNKRISALNADDSLIVTDWALNADNYSKLVKAAENEWISVGYKNEVEQMNAFIDQVTKRNLVRLKDQLQENLDRAVQTDLVSGAKFYNTTFVPAGFATGDGWTKFSFSEDNVSTYDRSETNAWETESSFGFLLNANVSTNGEISSTEKTIDTTNFKMSFDIVQVPISRPWFSPEFLKNSAWRFAENKGMSPLSDGSKPPKGQLVAYPTTAVFVRNIVVNFKELHEKESTYAQAISAKADASYGIFCFSSSHSGSYNRSVEERKFDSKIGEQGLEVPGMQLIALKCSVLPQSPNPSSDITEWS